MKQYVDYGMYPKCLCYVEQVKQLSFTRDIALRCASDLVHEVSEVCSSG